jgi:hypothetical protein
MCSCANGAFEADAAVKGHCNMQHLLRLILVAWVRHIVQVINIIVSEIMATHCKEFALG